MHCSWVFDPVTCSPKKSIGHGVDVGWNPEKGDRNVHLSELLPFCRQNQSSLALNYSYKE